MYENDDGTLDYLFGWFCKLHCANLELWISRVDYDLGTLAVRRPITLNWNGLASIYVFMEGDTRVRGYDDSQIMQGLAVHVIGNQAYWAEIQPILRQAGEWLMQLEKVSLGFPGFAYINAWEHGYWCERSAPLGEMYWIWAVVHEASVESEMRICQKTKVYNDVFTCCRDINMLNPDQNYWFPDDSELYECKPLVKGSLAVLKRIESKLRPSGSAPALEPTAGHKSSEGSKDVNDDADLRRTIEKEVFGELKCVIVSQIEEIAKNKQITVDERLEELARIAPGWIERATSQALAQILGVHHSAIVRTRYWKEHKSRRKKIVVLMSGRRELHESRARLVDRYKRDDESC